MLPKAQCPTVLPWQRRPTQKIPSPLLKTHLCSTQMVWRIPLSGRLNRTNPLSTMPQYPLCRSWRVGSLAGSPTPQLCRLTRSISFNSQLDAIMLMSLFFILYMYQHFVSLFLDRLGLMVFLIFLKNQLLVSAVFISIISVLNFTKSALIILSAYLGFISFTSIFSCFWQKLGPLT